MAKDSNYDILLDEDGDDKVVNGDFAVGDGYEDDCLIICQLNKGVLKSEPMLGPNLILMINANKAPTEIKQDLRLALSSDGKDPQIVDIKEGNIVIGI